MGTDINTIIQTRDSADAPWRTVPFQHPALGDRNYNLFAQLAGVRNGRGFAGCDLGDGFIPICKPKGLPEGLSEWPEGEPDADDYSDNRPWLGEHTHSWLTVAELQAYDTSKPAIMRGVISRDEWLKWDGNRPASYCGDIYGPRVKVVTPKQAREPGVEFTHVRVSWSETYREAAGEFWTYVVPALAELGPAENVRLVFGFDS